MRRRIFLSSAAASIFTFPAVATADRALDPQRFEIIEPDPLAIDHMPALQEAYARAVRREVPLVLMSGDFIWKDPSESTALKLKSNSKVVFIGARIVWGCEYKYFAPFVMVGIRNVEIVNPRFLWLGKLTVGGDFYKDDPSFGFLPETRYGSKYPYAAHLFCTAILALESTGVKISGLRGESGTRDGRSVIHTWVSASRTNELMITDAELNDCVSGILTEGGNQGLFRNLRGGRLSQDIGIPGHILYTFMSNVEIEGVRDDGSDTGLSEKISSHSVSYGGNGPALISNIRSARLAGPLNIKNAKNGCEVKSVVWCPITSAKINAIDNPALYLVPKTGNDKIRMRQIRLDAAGVDMWLLGGDITNCDIEAQLYRTDDTALSKTGYFIPCGYRGIVGLFLSQRGQFDPPQTIGRKMPLVDAKIKLQLSGFSSPPTIDARAELGMFTGNTIEYSGARMPAAMEEVLHGASAEILLKNSVISNF